MYSCILLLFNCALTLGVGVYYPADGTLVLPNSTISSMYHLTNALSAGSKDVYVYVEPGHTLVHESHRPFNGDLSERFNITTPSVEGPFAIVYYDFIVAGVQNWPSVTVTTVGLYVTSVIPTPTAIPTPVYR
ncbi:hypothetical protein BCR33DRAFT_723865 [Rhizoclosmatium globosum]|uniref:Uncharacterized protein n=1 Tax=Rhizoclosmatium globosum TaxID=329046 RepID=A0A1Y2B9K2_9FUNG|nr:hypothetical protein BCR33DRAFT_723865 [Rhizoclosmatium globosum]|eukprot:ORY31509.1 hypothetical protein BCR33DRAFT_723865 [Rhizoclosmatium globosum]